MAANKLCKALSRDGKPCTRPAHGGTEFCFGHDPHAAKARAALAAKSARSKRRVARVAPVAPVATVRTSGSAAALNDVQVLMDAIGRIVRASVRAEMAQLFGGGGHNA